MLGPYNTSVSVGTKVIKGKDIGFKCGEPTMVLRSLGQR